MAGNPTIAPTQSAALPPMPAAQPTTQAATPPTAPAIPAAQPTQQPQSNSQSLDPSIVALAKAIRDNESPTSTPGASGEVGYYQFMPGKFQALAKQYLGDANAPMTKNNQNYVVYQQIKAWKEQGYNPGQIASMWNSGGPDPSGKVGTNPEGVAYNTPKYVQNVYQSYQKYKDSGTADGEGASGTPAIPQSPIATAESFGKKVLDTATNIADAIPGVKTLGDRLASTMVAKRYPKQAKEIMANAPTAEQTAGAGLEVASIPVAIAAAPVTAAGAIATGAGIGATQAAGAAMEKNAPAKEVAKQGAEGAGIGAATAGVVSGFGKFLEGAGAKILNSVIKPSSADIKDGFSMKTIKDMNLGGSLSTILDKTETKMGQLSSELKQKLASSDSTINLQDAFDNTAKRLTGSKLSSVGSNAAMKNALSWLQNELDLIGSDSISIPDAQLVKQGIGHYGAWQYGNPDPEATARQKVASTFYNELKTTIEKNSPEGVREINQQISKLIPVMNAVIRRIPIAERNNAISLGDVIGLATSHLNPAAIPFTILNFLSRQGAVGAALMKGAPAITKAAPAVSDVVNSILPKASDQTQTTTSQ